MASSPVTPVPANSNAPVMQQAADALRTASTHLEQAEAYFREGVNWLREMIQNQPVTALITLAAFTALGIAITTTLEALIPIPVLIPTFKSLIDFTLYGMFAWFALTAVNQLNPDIPPPDQVMRTPRTTHPTARRNLTPEFDAILVDAPITSEAS